jgi:hypothetical protein
MELSGSNLFIDRLSANEKERNIVASIKNVDDVLSIDLFDVVNSYIYEIMGYLSDYRNTPSITELKLFSFDRAINEFLAGDYSLEYLCYLVKCTERVCEDLSCSFNLYGAVAFSALWFIAVEDFHIASNYIKICFQPITSMMRIIDVPRQAGKLGGRPEHPLKTEAIKLAQHKWSSMDYASLNIVATAVKHQLEIKYKNPPSLPAIKKWIKDANIRPEKSSK